MDAVVPGCLILYLRKFGPLVYVTSAPQKEGMMKNDSVFAIDIDNTLCEEDVDAFIRYEKAAPIKENIAKVNRLFEDNTIIIYTSRFEEDKEVTEKWLKNHGVK